MTTLVGFDEGSFRDPAGRVFLHGDYAYRTLTKQSLPIARDVLESGLVADLAEAGLIAVPELVPASDSNVEIGPESPWLIRQRRVPFVTYAYEWSFEMLRRAALVTLEILQRSLRREFILKDAPSFNILFSGGRPVHIDFGSFVRRPAGVAWTGYAQFCRSFLYPLLIEAYAGIPFQPLLRGYLGELPIDVAADGLGWRRALRSGVLVHVLIQHQLQRRFSGDARSVAAATSSVAQPTHATAAMVRRLSVLIEGLRHGTNSTWREYTETCSYTGDERAVKRQFVEKVVADERPGRLLDLGCNTGEYIELVLPLVGHVVGVDADAAAIDACYGKFRGDHRVSLAVADIANPTPPLGWALRERQALLPRLQADFLLALALVHHLRITAGIPLARVVPALLSLAPSGIIEWVGREDAMVQRMLALREDVFTDYEWHSFLELLHQHAGSVDVVSVRTGRALCRYSCR